MMTPMTHSLIVANSTFDVDCRFSGCGVWSGGTGDSAMPANLGKDEVGT